VTATNDVTASHAAQSRMPSVALLASMRRCCALTMTAHTSVSRAANTEPRLKPASIAAGSSENVNGELHAPVSSTTPVARPNSNSSAGAVLRSSV
jgi:hypothetical protein